MENTKSRLVTLEAGRFVAAALVVCVHFTAICQDLRHGPMFGWALRAGHAGVEYFFVLSGFIIYQIHRGDIGRPEMLRLFGTKRFIRIYPIYWLVCGAILVAMVFKPDMVHGRDIGLPHLIPDLLILPLNGSDGVVPVSWTLRQEIVFYAIFGLAILAPRPGIVLFIVWQLVALVSAGFDMDTHALRVIKPFASIYNSGFLIGIAAAWMAKRVHPRHPEWLILMGGAAFLTLMMVEDMVFAGAPIHQSSWTTPVSPLLYSAAAGVMILGLALWEQQRRVRGEKALLVLGGASYLLYLIHEPIGSVLIRVMSVKVLAALPMELTFLVMLIGACGAAIAGHLWLEKPLLRILRARLLAKPRAQNVMSVT